MTEIGRNDPCHCGSGKKYKKCHLEKDEGQNRKEREKAALNAAKVMAEKVADVEKAGEKATPAHTGPTHTRREGWIKKVAGKVGFFRQPTQRKAPPTNKGG